MLELRAAILILVLGYAFAQNPSCDYYQAVQPSQTYYVYSPNYPNNYTGTLSCRWIGSCPPGYNCKLECPEVYIPYTSGCTADRLLISKTGDPLLTAAEKYCGSGQITIVSTLQQISVGLVASNSKGGRFFCRLTAVPATDTGNCRCGYKKTNRIVGGEETGVNEFPMMVALADRSISEVKCGGVIIDKRWVMTAAHCLVSQTLNNIAVIVGEHDVTTGSDTNAVQGFAPKRFIIHPNFNQNNYDNDIALIELNSDIVFNERVGPVCLPFKFLNADFANAKFTALGWGTLFIGGPKSDVLRKVNLDVISQNTCRQSSSVSDRQICTFTPGKDACQDDSGGPMLYTDPSTGLLFSTGIISYGQLCASGKPGINTRVTSFLEWIVTNTQVNFCRK